MKPIIDAYWNELKSTAEYYKKKNKGISFDESKYQVFYDMFKKNYQKIQHTYMKENVTALDRHKVAAVMIVTSIETKVVWYDAELAAEQCFLGSEMFSTEVALSWMLNQLNKKLVSAGEKSISFYHMPRAFSCDTPYFEIFTRNLFFTHRDYKLSPLDVSEKLFLLEYISLIKNNIDPSVLCS